MCSIYACRINSALDIIKIRKECHYVNFVCGCAVVVSASSVKRRRVGGFRFEMAIIFEENIKYCELYDKI